MLEYDLMTNNCKDCNTELMCLGVHKEAPEYRKWECPTCKSKKKLSFG